MANQKSRKSGSWNPLQLQEKFRQTSQSLKKFQRSLKKVPVMYPGGHGMNSVNSDFTPDDKAPLFTTNYLQGYRMWTWDMEKMRLKSMTYSYWWENGENHATHMGGVPNKYIKECKEKFHPDNSTHQPECMKKYGCRYPTKDCQCGFYAYMSNKVYDHSKGLQKPVVFGVIAGWGRCVVGPLGFKSQFAEIMALSGPIISPEPWARTLPGKIQPESNALARQFFAKYGCHSVEDVHNHIRTMAAEAYRGVQWFDTQQELLGNYPAIGPLGNVPKE